MAREKFAKWWPAIAHGLTYTAPFVVLVLILARTPLALLALAVIGGTHIVLDHYRAAKYVVWAKNLIAPRAARLSWAEAKAADNGGFSAMVPPGLASAMLIIVDNTIHLTINTIALLWLI
jgi:hypothetical protein